MIRFEGVGKRYANGHVGLHELSFRVRFEAESFVPALFVGVAQIEQERS